MLCARRDVLIRKRDCTLHDRHISIVVRRSKTMKLFIAIELPDIIKAELEKSASLLRCACIGGTFSPGKTTISRLLSLAKSRLRASGKSRMPWTAAFAGRFP